MRAQIIGTGSYLPTQTANNYFLSTFIDTNDEWIQTRTGIQQRHLASNGESTVTMAVEAAHKAMQNADVTGEDIDLIVVATCSADMLIPSTACYVQHAIDATKAIAFDINAACSGFIYALSIVDAYFQAGIYKTALIIGAETMSKLVDWKDRSTCILFGDGAGAVVVTAAEQGMIAVSQGSDGNRKDALTVKGRGIRNPFETAESNMDYMQMKGQEIFKFAVKTVPQNILETLKSAGLSPDDVNLFFLHQANARINQKIAQKLKVPAERFPQNIRLRGNTSAASIPVLLDESNRAGKISSGSIVVLAGFGAGLTWGSCVLTWK